MSYPLSQKVGVTARKKYHCDLCGEVIHIGERYDVRCGVSSGDGWYTMRMHPECQRYEQTPAIRKQLNEWDWYEDASEPAFPRSEVHRAEELLLN
jgi:hypothetical protein